MYPDYRPLHVYHRPYFAPSPVKPTPEDQYAQTDREVEKRAVAAKEAGLSVTTCGYLIAIRKKIVAEELREE